MRLYRIVWLFHASHSNFVVLDLFFLSANSDDRVTEQINRQWLVNSPDLIAMTELEKSVHPLSLYIAQFDVTVSGSPLNREYGGDRAANVKNDCPLSVMPISV